jgi:ABC-type Fe3+ transport system permease subunit
MLSRLFRRTSCPLPEPGQRRASLRPHHLLPLVGFLVPTIVIGYGVVLPEHAPGINELSVGFATTLIGVVITYVVGVVGALRRP